MLQHRQARWLISTSRAETGAGPIRFGLGLTAANGSIGLSSPGSEARRASGSLLSSARGSIRRQQQCWLSPFSLLGATYCLRGAPTSVVEIRDVSEVAGLLAVVTAYGVLGHFTAELANRYEAAARLVDLGAV